MKKEKIKIAFVGCGQFCRGFVPLFKAHPAVDFIAVCDKPVIHDGDNDEIAHSNASGKHDRYQEGNLPSFR